MSNYLRLKFIRGLLLAILLMAGIAIQAQITVGINSGTVNVSPGYTVTNNTPITVTGSFKNTGSLPITDNILVNLAIDTSTTSTPKYYWRSTTTYSVTNFTPASIFNFTVTDVASAANSYKVAGNGTTVVIWAMVGVSTNVSSSSDSATTNVFIISIPVDVEEQNRFSEYPVRFKNPLSGTIQLHYDEAIYTEVELINSLGVMVPDVITNKTIDVNTLAGGIYYLRFFNATQHTYLIKKVIIE